MLENNKVTTVRYYYYRCISSYSVYTMSYQTPVLYLKYYTLGPI